MTDRPPWENDDGSTNVEGFLGAYAADDNTFWRADHCIERAEERDVLEAAIQGHGGNVLRGEFVRRGGDVLNVYIEWPKS